MRSNHSSAFIALAVLALVWGYNWVAMKVALDYAPPFSFSALRACGSTLVLFIPLLISGKSRLPKARRQLVWLALLQTFGFMALASFALSLGNAGKATILAYTMPFWVLILAVPWLGEKLTRGKLLAATMGVVGVLLIFSPWRSHPDLRSLALAAGAGFLWAVAVIVFKRLHIHDTWELLAFNAWQMLIGAIPLGIVAILLPQPAVHWTVPFDLSLGYSIFFGTSLAWFLWLFILSRMPAGLSGLSALIIPVVGVLAAWLQLGEEPHLWEAMGIISIVIGLAALSRLEWRAAQAARDFQSND